MKDLRTGSIKRVSVNTSGAEADEYSFPPTISSHGRYIAFSSDATNFVKDDTNTSSDIFVRDTRTNTLERVSTSTSGGQADGGSYSANISKDGQHIAFESDATNLAKDDRNVSVDVFVSH